MSDQPTGPNAELIGRIQNAGRLFAVDLGALSDEHATTSPGGKARTALDITFEVTAINNMVASSARGEEQTFNTPQGWMTAPEGLTKQEALAQFEASVSSVCDAMANVGPESFSKPVQTPFGESTFGFLANMVPTHIMYHSGQLNYIQTLNGDDAFHWMG